MCAAIVDGLEAVAAVMTSEMTILALFYQAMKLRLGFCRTLVKLKSKDYAGETAILRTDQGAMMSIETQNNVSKKLLSGEWRQRVEQD